MKLLLDEKPLLILPSLAEKIGLNESIVLQQIHYWLSVSDHIREGKKWTYGSYPEWQKQFPWWSIKTVQRIFSSLENKGLLISGEFNRKSYDRSKWYTINYEALNKLDSSQNDQMDQVNLTSPSSQNDQMDQVNLTSPIPEISTKTSTKTSTEISTEKYTCDFEKFWNEYPRHIGKEAAFRCWLIRLKEKFKPDELITAAQNYASYCVKNRIEMQYIKHPSTFLGRDKPFKEFVRGQPELLNCNKSLSTITTDKSRERGLRLINEL